MTANKHKLDRQFSRSSGVLNPDPVDIKEEDDLSEQNYPFRELDDKVNKRLSNNRRSVRDVKTLPPNLDPKRAFEALRFTLFPIGL